MLKLKLQYLVTWCEELTHWKRPWCWKRLKVGGEGDDRGWDGWHHQLNGHEFEQTPRVCDGQGGLACCSPWGRKELDITEQLNCMWPLHWAIHIGRKRGTIRCYAAIQCRLKVHRCVNILELRVKALKPTLDSNPSSSSSWLCDVWQNKFTKPASLSILLIIIVPISQSGWKYLMS